MDRRTVLDRGPASLGSSWASALGESLRGEGRVVAGGWPGTIVEARARVARFLNDELAGKRMPPLSLEELAAATNATYARAKGDWLQMTRRSKLDPRRHAGVEE